MRISGFFKLFAVAAMVFVLMACPEEEAPAAPTGVSAAVVSSGVKVTWNRVSNASGYYVYRKTATSGNERIAKVKDSSSDEYTDTSGTAGASYTYAVAAFNDVGTSKTSSWSTAVTFPGSVTQGTVPAKPTGVSATVISNGVKVTWNRVTDANGYYVYRKAEAGEETRIATVQGSSSDEYSNTSGTADTSYLYSVAAFNDTGTSGRSEWSTAVVFPTIVTPPQAPAAPTNVKAVAQSYNSITVSWNSVTNVTGYNVYRDSNSDGTYTNKVSGSTPLTGTSFTDTSLQANTNYYYKVSAVNSEGEGNKSGYVTAKTLTSQVGSVNWDNEPNGTITIINSTVYDMVLFVRSPSISNLIGGVRAGEDVVKNISNKFIDFAIGGPVVIQAMKLTEYNTNINDLTKGKIEYSAFAAYGEGKYYRAILTSDYDGNYGYKVFNTTLDKGLELRRNGVSGEKIAYVSPGEILELRAKTMESINLFPVWVAYNTISKSLVYYETTDWRDTERAAPRAASEGYETYDFPPSNAVINFDDIILPYATITVTNTTSRVAEFWLGSTNLLSQNNFPNLPSGRFYTYDITGGPDNKDNPELAGSPLLLNLNPISNVVVPVRFEGATTTPRIINGYIYEIEFKYNGDTFGNDIMNPLNYSAILVKVAKVDVSQFLTVSGQ